MIGKTELLLIMLIALLVFGASRFPKIMENLGKGVNIFKKTLNEDKKKPTANPKGKKPTKPKTKKKR